MTTQHVRLVDLLGPKRPAATGFGQYLWRLADGTKISNFTLELGFAFPSPDPRQPGQEWLSWMKAEGLTLGSHGHKGDGLYTTVHSWEQARTIIDRFGLSLEGRTATVYPLNECRPFEVLITEIIGRPIPDLGEPWDGRYALFASPPALLSGMRALPPEDRRRLLSLLALAGDD